MMEHIKLTVLIAVVTVVMCFGGCSKAYASVLSEESQRLDLSEIYKTSDFPYVLGYKGTNGAYYISYMKTKPKLKKDQKVGYFFDGEAYSFRLESDESLLEAAKKERKIEEGRTVGVTVRENDILFINFDTYDGNHYISAHGYSDGTLFGMSPKQLKEASMKEVVSILPAALVTFISILAVRKALSWVVEHMRRA